MHCAKEDIVSGGSSAPKARRVRLSVGPEKSIPACRRDAPNTEPVISGNGSSFEAFCHLAPAGLCLSWVKTSRYYRITRSHIGLKLSSASAAIHAQGAIGLAFMRILSTTAPRLHRCGIFGSNDCRDLSHVSSIGLRGSLPQ
jgi:hypothetical protein